MKIIVTNKKNLQDSEVRFLFGVIPINSWIAHFSLDYQDSFSKLPKIESQLYQWKLPLSDRSSIFLIFGKILHPLLLSSLQYYPVKAYREVLFYFWRYRTSSNLVWFIQRWTQGRPIENHPCTDYFLSFHTCFCPDPSICSTLKKDLADDFSPLSVYSLSPGF